VTSLTSSDTKNQDNQTSSIAPRPTSRRGSLSDWYFTSNAATAATCGQHTRVKGIFDHDNRPTHHHNAGTMLNHAELLDLDDAKVLGGRMLRRMLSPGMWLTKWLTYPPDSNPADWYQFFLRRALFRFQETFDVHPVRCAEGVGNFHLVIHTDLLDI
jgi:hypothetical protein